MNNLTAIVSVAKLIPAYVTNPQLCLLQVCDKSIRGKTLYKIHLTSPGHIKVHSTIYQYTNLCWILSNTAKTPNHILVCRWAFNCTCFLISPADFSSIIQSQVLHWFTEECYCRGLSCGLFPPKWINWAHFFPWLNNTHLATRKNLCLHSFDHHNDHDDVLAILEEHCVFGQSIWH